MKPAKTNFGRMYSLDILRGVAALSVVLWHWQHFFRSGSAYRAGFDIHEMPLYPVLKIFYLHGALAVDLFFSLSGFIFFLFYAETISSGKLKPAQFVILRLSRLYPLHFVTLLLVAIGQFLYFQVYGESLVYVYNDTRHFLLNILLVPSIGLERGHSFNGPAWSISVEIVLYAIFFSICWARLARAWLLALLSLCGFFILLKFYVPLGRGVGSFFLGGFVHYVFLRIVAHQERRLITCFVICGSAAMWIVVTALVYAEFSDLNFSLRWPISRHLPEAVVFPTTILALALMDYGEPAFTKKILFLGEISYSSYLIHFPLQIAFVLAAQSIGISPGFFSTPISLGLFFTALLLLSRISYRYFEVPAQRYLRNRCLGPRARGSSLPRVCKNSDF